MKHLIVEVNDLVRRLIRSVVAGFERDSRVRQLAEALATYNRHRPNFVLMDIHMNVMGGITAT